jgi:hypothetical protein
VDSRFIEVAEDGHQRSLACRVALGRNNRLQRTHSPDPPTDRENWYGLQNAAILLLASELKALAVALGLGIVGVFGLVLGSLAGLL